MIRAFMITYRQLARAELDLAITWATSEGWNPGKHDAEAFWAADPEGFAGAEWNGELIATGSIVSYDGWFGYMGFFMVRPDLRGQGIGRQFWLWRRDTLLGRLRPGASIGMDGVFAMQPFYAKGGFGFAHRNLRMAGRGRRGEVADSICELSEVPWAAVAEWDRQHFGFARPAFLRCWIAPEGGLALGIWDGKQERLSGMGVIRPCQEGFKIGPLFAKTPEAAEDLFQALSDHAAGELIFLDTPENHAGARALAVRHGMTDVFGCARMYYGQAPVLPWNQIYGVTSFELG